MRCKPWRKRTGRHALVATGAALVLAASSGLALVDAGSASAAESPSQAWIVHPTARAGGTYSICTFGPDGELQCIVGTYQRLRHILDAKGVLGEVLGDTCEWTSDTVYVCPLW